MPTEDVLHEYKQVEMLLRLFGTCSKEVVAYAAKLWLENKAYWCSYTDRRPLDVLRDHVDVDFFYEQRYDKHESKDLKDARFLVTQLAVQVFDSIMPTLDVFQIPDFILERLQTHEWLGNCLIVSSPNLQPIGTIEHYHA